MTTAPHDPTVAERMVKQLTDALLTPRRDALKGRAPKHRTVYQNRRNIACGKAKPVQMILAQSLADLDDGAPIGDVERFYLEAVEALRLYRSQRHSTGVGGDTSILPFILRENRKEALEGEAEDRVLEHQRSANQQAEIESLRALLSASAAERQEQERRDQVVRERLASLHSVAAPMSVQQPPHVAHSRPLSCERVV